MIRAVVIILAYLAICQAQPPSCQEDSQCTDGQYCEPYSLTCHKCLRCEDLKREPPALISSCIKSVVECGNCFKGLIEDRSDVNAPCISSNRSSDDDSQQMQEGLPAYVWGFIVLGVAVTLVFIILIVIYVFKHPLTIKASTHTSVRSPSCSAAASAPALPQPPPPYQATVGPHAPPSAPWHNVSPDTRYEEEWPLNVKRASLTRPTDARESAASQAALVYNNPVYVRVPEQPPSDTETFIIEDEETRESTWSPTEQTNSTDINANAAVGGEGNSEVTEVSGGSGSGADLEAAAAPDLGSLLAGARSSTLVRARDYPPPAKMMRLSQDSNNNRSRSEEAAGGHGASEGAQSGPSFIINVVQNINAVQPSN